MYTCRYCKAEHQESVKFCTKCGMKMKVEEPQEVSSASEEKKEDHSAAEDASAEKGKKETADSQKNGEEKIADSKDSTDSKASKKEDSDDEEDPFVYKFDSGSGSTKKSGDGVWLAIVAIVVVIAIIIIGTSRKNAQEQEAADSSNETSIIEEVAEGDSESADDAMEQEDGASEEDGEDVDESQDEGEQDSEEQPEEAMKNEESAEEAAPSGPSESASSTLVDTSAYNFDYSPSQVKDKDFSTAWIEAERDAGIDEYVMVGYGEDKEIDKLGIVPGYGRDEEIYNENNRVKKLVLEFSDGSTVEKELEDKYGMHILEFDRRTTSSVKVIIKEVYSGSKYNDTAISEIDVDSDYVKNNDPEGALRFYEENKKESAKRPS